MKTITSYVILLTLCLIVPKVNGQETKKENVSDTISVSENKNKIDKLKARKSSIEQEERDFLKAEVENINQSLDSGKITKSEAEKLKKEAAIKHAANIEDRIAIVNSKIKLLERNPQLQNIDDGKVSISFGSNGLVVDLTQGERKPPKYDIRTTNKMVIAIGLNNAIGDEQSLGDSPYEIGGSGFFELGWVWQTRLAKNSNFARLNYGFSFQWNKLNVKDDLYFVQDGNVTTLEEFPVDLRKSQLRVTNLVVPVHFEFGPSRLKDYGNRIRYFNDDKFKIGVGGYAGLRLATQQKLRYDEAGDPVKSKSRRNFNASNFVYGLSGYIGFGDLSLYAKYDLNPLFDNQQFDQHNVSLGLRFDFQ